MRAPWGRTFGVAFVVLGMIIVFGTSLPWSFGGVVIAFCGGLIVGVAE